MVARTTGIVIEVFWRRDVLTRTREHTTGCLSIDRPSSIGSNRGVLKDLRARIAMEQREGERGGASGTLER